MIYNESKMTISGDKVQTDFSIDHIFLFVKDAHEAIRLGTKLGLQETYRRTHPGQGTSNICYCFDNTFIELIWVSNQDDIQSKAIHQTKLYERSISPTNGSCPLGISYRLNSQIESFKTWDFNPPYLSDHSIKVSMDSLSEANPFIFQAISTKSPKDWDKDKKNDLQRRKGFKNAQFLMSHPLNYIPCDNLKALALRSDLKLKPNGTSNWGLNIYLEKENGSFVEKVIF